MELTKSFESTIQEICNAKEKGIIDSSYIKGVEFSIAHIISCQRTNFFVKIRRLLKVFYGQWNSKKCFLAKLSESNERESQMQIIDNILFYNAALTDCVNACSLKDLIDFQETAKKITLKYLNKSLYKKYLKDAKKKRRKDSPNKEKKMYLKQEIDYKLKTFDIGKMDEYAIFVKNILDEELDQCDTNLLLDLMKLLHKCRGQHLFTFNELVLQIAELISSDDNIWNSPIRTIFLFAKFIRKSNLNVHEGVLELIFEKFVSAVYLDRCRVSLEKQHVKEILQFFYDQEHFDKILSFPEPSSLSSNMIYSIQVWKAESLRKQKKYDECLALCESLRPQTYEKLSKEQISLLCCLAYANKHIDRYKGINVLRNLKEYYGKGHHLSTRILCGLVFLRGFLKDEIDEIEETLRKNLFEYQNGHSSHKIQEALKILRNRKKIIDI